MSTNEALHVPLAEDWNDSDVEEDHSFDQSINQKRYCTTCCRGLTRRQLLVLIGVIVILLVVSLAVIFTVIIPKIIQSTINGSEIQLTNIRLGIPYQSTDPSTNQISDQSMDWYIPMTADMAILNTGPFSATIEPMTSEIRYRLSNQSLDQTPSPLVGTLDLPEISVHGDIYQSLNQSMRITNETAFDNLMKTLLNEPSVDWLIDCSGTIALGSLKYQIQLSKAIRVLGMNGLNNVTVESFSMDQSTNQSINVNMNITIFNPSDLSVQSLGDLHFDVLYPNSSTNQPSDLVVIGGVWAYNVSMAPNCSNQLTLSGQLSSDESASHAQQLLVESFLRGSPSLVYSVARSINQSNNVFAGGVNGLMLDVVLPGNTINLVDQLVYQSISLTPSSVNQSVMLDANVSITINSPLGDHSFIDVLNMSLIGDLMYGDLLIGVIDAPMSAVYETDSQFVFNTSIRAAMVLDGDGSAFAQFVHDFVVDQSISLAIAGNTSIRALYPLGPLSATDIPIVTLSTLAGMNGLNAVEQGLNILGPRSCSQSPSMTQHKSTADVPPYCGELVALTATLFNPSAASVDLKGSMFDMWYDSPTSHFDGQSSLLLGLVSSAELVVRPQDNVEVLTGALYPASSNRSVPHVPSGDEILMADFIDRFLHGEQSSVRLAGKADPSLPPNSAAALAARAVNLTASVPGQNVAQQLITGLRFNTFHINFDQDEPEYVYVNDGLVFVDTVIDASFQLPQNLRLSMNISQVDLVGTVLFNDQEAGQLQLVNQPVVHVHGVDGDDQLLLTIADAQLVIGNSSNIFEKFATALVLDEYVEFGISTHANPTASTALGVLSLHNVTALDSAVFKGLNSFQSNNRSVLSILGYSIIDATSDWMMVNCSIEIASPSNVSISGLGEMLLDLYVVDGTSSLRLGRVRLADFSLPLGTSYMSGIANLSAPTTPAHTQALRAFISAMINQSHSEIALHGLILEDDGEYVPGTEVTLLQPAISALITDTTFPGLKDQFIVTYQSQLTLTQLATLLVTGKCSMSTRMQVNNPFDTYIGIGSSNINVFIAGTQFQMGSWIDSKVDPPILIQPNSVSITEQNFIVSIDLSGDEIQKLYDILNATIHGEPLYLDSFGSILTGISMEPELSSLNGSFVTYVDVDARGVPCVLTIV